MKPYPFPYYTRKKSFDKRPGYRPLSFEVLEEREFLSGNTPTVDSAMSEWTSPIAHYASAETSSDVPSVLVSDEIFTATAGVPLYYSEEDEIAPFAGGFEQGAGIPARPSTPGIPSGDTGGVAGNNGGGRLPLQIKGFSGYGNAYYLDINDQSLPRTVWLYAQYFRNQARVSPMPLHPVPTVTENVFSDSLFTRSMFPTIGLLPEEVELPELEEPEMPETAPLSPRQEVEKLERTLQRELQRTLPTQPNPETEENEDDTGDDTEGNTESNKEKNTEEPNTLEKQAPQPPASPVPDSKDSQEPGTKKPIQNREKSEFEKNLTPEIFPIRQSATPKRLAERHDSFDYLDSIDYTGLG